LIELYDAKKTPCPSGVCQVNLNKEGKYHVQLNAFTEDVSAGGHFLVNGVEMTRAVDTCSNCTYTSLEPLDIVENANTFTFQAVKIGTFKTHWIKILDHPDYIMTTDDTIHEVPENKFIGSGERWFASDDMAGHFEGFHKVRFKVWVV
jgi:predicted nucleic-acid-binding Zn-ribbon protein